MKGKSHKWVTCTAFDILREVDDETPPFLADDVVAVADHARKTDHYRDLEFVDVDKDRMHKTDEEPYHGSIDSDIIIFRYVKLNFTAFNHYIDIKKADITKKDGEFDDYDGYSYNRGSASKDEYQSVADFIGDIVEDKIDFPEVFRLNVGPKVDTSIHSLALKDDYVCAPGHEKYRYRKSSPSLELYFFPDYKGKCKNVEYECMKKECIARFPMIDTIHGKGGVPWSVFMPVDNMARHWWQSKFLKTSNPADLGPVMHAIQDASVPHHAAGCCGNWHHKYEKDLQSKMPEWLVDADFAIGVKELFTGWNHDDELPPSHLNVGDWDKTPARNWRIDQLVTWVALNAYREYDKTYNHFKDDYKFDEYSAIYLVKIATAMSLLVLKNAADHLKSMS